MKYKGKEIGKPTIETIQNCIDENFYNLSAEKIYKACEKRKWRTRQGTPIKSLECLVSAYNGIGTYKNVSNNKKKEIRKEKRRENVESLKRLMKAAPADEDNHDTYIIYKEQMNDPRWLAFRHFVLTVRGEFCECCGSNNILQVHHLQYQKKRLAWEYTVNDVRVLCKICHMKVHNLV